MDYLREESALSYDRFEASDRCSCFHLCLHLWICSFACSANHPTDIRTSRRCDYRKTHPRCERSAARKHLRRLGPFMPRSGTERQQTDLDGSLFPAAGSFQWNPLPLGDFRDSWLTVNEDREGSTGGEEGSAATQVLYNPMSNRRGWPVGDKGYFPLTMTFRRDGCDRVWDAACVFKIFRLGVYSPSSPSSCPANRSANPRVDPANAEAVRCSSGPLLPFHTHRAGPICLWLLSHSPWRNQRG